MTPDDELKKAAEAHLCEHFGQHRSTCIEHAFLAGAQYGRTQVLALLRSAPRSVIENQFFNDEWADWLESKLKGDK